MRVGVIVNPISGYCGRRPAAGRERVACAERLVAERPALEADVAVTIGPGHAAALSRAFLACGADVIIAWGGDGTINEAAGPLVGSRVPLGIVAAGSGDGLVGGLDLPREAAAAFDAAVSGQAGAIDVGFCGDRHFLNTAGVGFDAAVAADFNNSRRRGTAGYVTRIGRMIWRYRPRHYDVRLDDIRVQGRHLMVAFANGREYGSRLRLAPGADPRDGWLDAVLVADGPPWRQLWRARRLVLWSGRPAEGIRRVRVRAASVSGERLQCHVDGESFEASGTLEVRLVPRALRVCGIPQVA